MQELFLAPQTHWPFECQYYTSYNVFTGVSEKADDQSGISLSTSVASTYTPVSSCHLNMRERDDVNTNMHTHKILKAVGVVDLCWTTPTIWPL